MNNPTAQPLLTSLTLELWIAIILRDLEPLGLTTVDKVLKDLGLPRTAVTAALRHAIYDALRVVWITQALGPEGLPPESPELLELVGGAGDAAARASQAKLLVERCEECLEESDLGDERLLLAMAEAITVRSPAGYDDLANVAGKLLRGRAAAIIGGQAPVISLLERRDLFFEGVHYFFIEQLRVVPGVGGLITVLENFDQTALEERVRERKRELKHRLSVEKVDLRALVWQEKLAALSEISGELAASLEVARHTAKRRAIYKTIFEPLLLDLETLHRRVERGQTRMLKRAGGGTGGRDRYTIPLEEGEQLQAASMASQPDDPVLLFHRANSAFQQGLNKKAIRDYERLLELTPDNAAAAFNLGQVLLRVGDFPRALHAYRQAIEHDPKLKVLPDEFTLDAYLATDGLGIQLTAIDARGGQRRTIRLIKPSLSTDKQAIAEFVADLKVMRKVSGEALLRPIEVRKHRSHYLTVSEHVDGARLSSILSSGPLPVERTAEIVGQLIDAIAGCHEQGVVHGCLRPDCLVLDAGGKLRIGDFFLWTLMKSQFVNGPDRSLPLTCMPPEQQAGHGASPAADVFAIATIYYAMLRGMQALRREARTFAELPGGTALLLARGLLSDPGKRATLEELRALAVQPTR